MVVTDAIVGANILDYASIPEAVYTGKTLVGWAYDALGATMVAAGENITDGLTVYAIWETNTYTVTYVLNGGNIDGSTANVVETGVEYGTLVGSAYNGGTPVYTLYTWTTPFWVTTAEGSTDAASVAVTANVTVYAYWVLT